MTVRFAVVGCGLISDFHLRAIAALEDAELAGVQDVVSTACEQVARAYGVHAYRSLEEIATDASVDAVCICTPSGLHAAQAMQMIQAGKHVLVEKPLALCLADCDRLIDAAQIQGVKLAVVSQSRFSETAGRIKQALDEGLLGHLVSADLYMQFYRPQSYYDGGQWRGTWAMDGGGSLMNQGIHGVDLMRYWMGTPASIMAVGGTLARDIEVEDTLSALVQYTGGAIGVIQAATSTYPGFPKRFALHGDRGVILVEEENILRWEVEGSPFYQAQSGPAAQSGGFNDPAKIDALGHQRQLQNLISAIRDDTPLQSDGQEGRATLSVILGAYEAMQTGKKIRLPGAQAQ